MQLRKRLGDILISRNLITAEQLAQALETQLYRQQPLGQILVQLGFVTAEMLDRVFEEEQNGAQVSVVDQPEAAALDYAALDQLVADALSQMHTLEVVTEDVDGDGQFTEADSRPVVSLVNQILTEAVRRCASDIHIEPRRERVEVRYRVDGQLQKVHELPAKLKAGLVARIKVLANLDIVEYRIPQDGRITLAVDGHEVDMRVSVLPNVHGQRTVLRILDKRFALRQMSELGFSESSMALFEDMITRPHGMILVTGPTGSGKTTTLYAALNRIREITNNVMTCEDPVEYDVEGLNQSQVNEKVGLTFAAQLRAILRQDPDVILVGEIRDRETADMAVRAAMTGHLVFSTLHSNDAVSAIPRLTDMGVEPFLLSTTLNGVLAQRLVRTLCRSCKQPYHPNGRELATIHNLFEEEAPVLWRAVGCRECNNTGYKGRTGVHELFPVSPQMQEWIAAGESLATLKRLALRSGFRPMYRDAWERVKAGQTSFGEVQKYVLFDSLTHSPDLHIEEAA